MKEFKTYNQQLNILRQRGLIVPKDGKPKRFLEQENYYNVINGYKDLFLEKDSQNNPVIPEKYLPNAHFNELKSLFLFDRELRSVLLKYLLIFENSFKTVYSHEFTKKYRKPSSYLEIKNYNDNDPKNVLQQISLLTSTIRDKVDREGPIKHYIEEHGEVPLWVLVNYLTIGNLSHLYSVIKESDRNTIAKYYSLKYNKQYGAERELIVRPGELNSALKVFNILRNMCAHDERIYNVNFKNVNVNNVANYFGIQNIDNRKIIVVIIYLKVLLNKNYYDSFFREINQIFNKYKNSFKTISFTDILFVMGIDINEFEKLK